MLATPIVVYLFGGVSGSDIDKYWAILVQSGHEVFSSAFLIRLPANFGDKLVSCGVVWLALRWVPPRWRGFAEGKGATSFFSQRPMEPDEVS